MAGRNPSSSLTRAFAAGLAIALTPASLPANPLPEHLWDRQEAERQASSEAASQRLSGLLDYVTDATADEMLSALHELQADEQLTLPAQERLLWDFAIALRERSPTAAGRRALQWLSGYQSRIFVAHEESRGLMGIPLYRVAAAARGTLTVWEQRQALAEAQAALAGGQTRRALPASAGDAPANDGSAEGLLGLRQALETAPMEQIIPVRERVLLEMRASAELAPVAAVLARRLQDPALFLAVLESDDRLTATRLLPETRLTLSPSQAYAVLTRVASERPLTSMAMMEVGRLAPDLPAAREFLFAKLSDADQGVSAAASLAAMQDPDVVETLARLLETATDEALLGNALLALRLDGSRQARTVLSQFAKDANAPESLRQEVTKWLAL